MMDDPFRSGIDLIAGTVASTGKWRRTSTSLSLFKEVSRISSKRVMPQPSASPPASPPNSKLSFFGKEGLSGKIRRIENLKLLPFLPPFQIRRHGRLIALS